LKSPNQYYPREREGGIQLCIKVKVPPPGQCSGKKRQACKSQRPGKVLILGWAEDSDFALSNPSLNNLGMEETGRINQSTGLSNTDEPRNGRR
jgi:hypothetical protein